MPWKLGAETIFFQSILYQLSPTLKFWFGSKMKPAVVLSDFSGSRFGLPANTPEICTPFTFVSGSLTCWKKVATDGEISGRLGARKPLPQLARSRSESVALNFAPTFGVEELP